MSITLEYLKKRSKIAVIIEINRISLINKFCLGMSSLDIEKDSDNVYICLLYSNKNGQITFECCDSYEKISIIKCDSYSMIEDFLEKINSIGYKITCYHSFF